MMCLVSSTRLNPFLQHVELIQQGFVRDPQMLLSYMFQFLTLLGQDHHKVCLCGPVSIFTARLT